MMGRMVDSSDEEEDAASCRKVVLLRPHTAAADSAAGPERGTPVRGADPGTGSLRGMPATRPQRAASGPAGRIMEWLSQNNKVRRQPTKPKALGARHLATAMKAAQAHNTSSAKGSRPAARPVRKPVRAHAVNALNLCGEVVLRSASPCSPEAPIRSRRHVGSQGHEKRSSFECRHSSDSSLSSSPVVEVRNNASKRQRIVKPPTVTDSVLPPSTATRSGVVTPPRAAATADERTFQAAVLERLRAMCGEHEDAKVLAEYIVVMVAGNKGREEMTVELKPFFQDQAQAESFVEWVEECKWKFLTGGPSPSKPPGGETRSPELSPRPIPGSLTQAGDVSASQPSQRELGVVSTACGAVASVVASPAAAPSVPARAKAVLCSDFKNSAVSIGSVFEVPVAPVAAAKSSAQINVSGRTQLQLAPCFEGSPPPQAPARGAASMQQGTSSSASSSAVGPVFSKTAAAARTVGGNPVRREKTELLKNMTKQLQVILTKLSDKSLKDEVREKYQALAQNVQTQMAKISRPPQPRRRM